MGGHYRCASSKSLPNHEIEAEEADDPSNPSLRLATMQDVRGLEFDHMILPKLRAERRAVH